MNASRIIEALGLPAEALVRQRVPKKLLLEHGAPTAADKRRITEGIESVQWVAALKPATIGVSEYRDDTREYLEVVVLHVVLRPGAKAGRLAELAHRAVPYPAFLVLEQEYCLSLSLAHKRWSLGESGKTVLDGDLVAVGLDGEVKPEFAEPFLSALDIARQPRGSLLVLYQGWLDTLLALDAARRIGSFSTPTSSEHAAARREALQHCTELEARVVALRSAAAKEKQLPRLVELNLELKRAQAALAAARERL